MRTSKITGSPYGFYNTEDTNETKENVSKEFVVGDIVICMDDVNFSNSKLRWKEKYPILNIFKLEDDTYVLDVGFKLADGKHTVHNGKHIPGAGIHWVRANRFIVEAKEPEPEIVIPINEEELKKNEEELKKKKKFKFPEDIENVLDTYINKLENFNSKMSEEKIDVLSQQAKLLEVILNTDMLDIE